MVDGVEYLFSNGNRKNTVKNKQTKKVSGEVRCN